METININNNNNNNNNNNINNNSSNSNNKSSNKHVVNKIISKFNRSDTNNKSATKSPSITPSISKQYFSVNDNNKPGICDNSNCVVINSNNVITSSSSSASTTSSVSIPQHTNAEQDDDPETFKRNKSIKKKCVFDIDQPNFSVNPSTESSAVLSGRIDELNKLSQVRIYQQSQPQQQQRRRSSNFGDVIIDINIDKKNNGIIVYDDFTNIIGDNSNNAKFLFDPSVEHQQNNVENDHETSVLIRKSDKLNETSISTNEDSKPLLLNEFNSQKRNPKSIVKSPSNHSFTDKQNVKHRKHRLSLQCNNHNNNKNSIDLERPVLHVQFLQQSHNDSDNDEDAEQNIVHDDGAFSSDDNSEPNNNIISSNNNNNNNNFNNTNNNNNSNNNDDIKSIISTPKYKTSICHSPAVSSVTSTSSSSSARSNSSEDDDDDDDDDDEEDGSTSIDQMAKPPDGGWGWVIVFASFMVNMIADGITFSFGIIYVEFLNYFNEGKAKTAWIGSLFMAMPLLSGPIASFLTDRYGCRRVTIAGSILASIGFIISAFTNSIEMLFITFGIFAGFGLSLCYVAAVVIVAYYFDKKRSFATGLSVCGSGIGTFIFAPLTQFLIDEYGWRGTTLILAGVFLNMTVCGLLMRDLEWTKHRAKKLKAKARKRSSKLGISADSFSVSNSTNTGGTASNLQQNIDGGDNANGNGSSGGVPGENIDDSRLYTSMITLPTFIKNGESVPMEVLELMSTHRNIHHVIMRNYPGLAHSRSFSQPLSTSKHSTVLSPESAMSPVNPERMREKVKSRNIRDEQEFLKWLKRSETQPASSKDVVNRPTAAYLKDLRMHRHSLTYRGAMLNINRYRLRASSCPDIYRNSMTTIAKEKSQWGQGVEEFKILLLDMLDFSHFADIRFLFFAISNFLLYAWYDVPYVYLADNAIQVGFSETDASILISVIGIVNMFGEIILGWFGDRKWCTAGLIYAICIACCGVVTGLVPLIPTFGGLSVISGLFGLFIAANYALTSIILVELITLERFTNAYGLLLLVQGIANLIGPPLAGWITDVTGTYDLAFYLAGIFISISGVLMVVLPIHGKCKKYRSQQKQKLGQNQRLQQQGELHQPHVIINFSNGESRSNSKRNGSILKDKRFDKDLVIAENGIDNAKVNHV